MNAFDIVTEFERKVAAFAGSRYGVAVDSCTSALFLACKYLNVKEATIPARTYISVPAAIIHAGGSVRFEDIAWSGAYELKPYPIVDSAKRFRASMYKDGFHCVSFHAKKLLPIGRGGMILTDDVKAAQWYRQARHDGREGGKAFMDERIEFLGWNCYMTPEQAARGLHLLEGLRLDLPDLYDPYPDLREMPVFRQLAADKARCANVKEILYGLVA